MMEAGAGHPRPAPGEGTAQLGNVEPVAGESMALSSRSTDAHAPRTWLGRRWRAESASPQLLEELRGTQRAAQIRASSNGSLPQLDADGEPLSAQPTSVASALLRSMDAKKKRRLGAALGALRVSALRSQAEEAHGCQGIFQESWQQLLDAIHNDIVRELAGREASPEDVELSLQRSPC